MTNSLKSRKPRVFSLRQATCLLSAAVLCFCLSGCSSGLGAQPSPCDTVEQFAQAATRTDVEGMLACCSQSTNDIADSVFAISDTMFELAGVEGLDSKEMLFTLIPGLYAMSQTTDSTVDYSIAAVDLKEQLYDDEHATVTGSWEFTEIANGNENTDSAPLELTLVKEDGEWKIDFTKEIQAAIGSAVEDW